MHHHNSYRSHIELNSFGWLRPKPSMPASQPTNQPTKQTTTQANIQHACRSQITVTTARNRAALWACAAASTTDSVHQSHAPAQRIATARARKQNEADRPTQWDATERVLLWCTSISLYLSVYLSFLSYLILSISSILSTYLSNLSI